MTVAERYVLWAILQEIRPECAIEIGTSQGGSLSVIARYSQQVYSLDIDPTCAERLQTRCPNVTFLTGNSSDTLPLLLAGLDQTIMPLTFVLIDGDHSYSGVKRDIDILLTNLRPTRPIYILMHDSFYPQCRQGISDAAWTACPYVHTVELDFVPGIFHEKPEFYRQMFGGFAFALLLPTLRTEPLRISAEQELLFRIAFGHSLHPKTFAALLRELFSVLWLKAQGTGDLVKQRLRALAKQVSLR